MASDCCDEQSTNLEKIVVIGFIGGPGAGKGTQCSLLQKRSNCEHLSIGDVLREEMKRPESPFVEEIRANQMLGRVGRKELTVGLLRKRIEQAAQVDTRTVILDGFPRNMDQDEYFATTVKPLDLVILLECSPDLLVGRLARGGRSRADDNPETISKRLATFNDSTAKVIVAYESRAKLERVNAENSVEDVFAAVQDVLRKKDLI